MIIFDSLKAMRRYASRLRAAERKEENKEKREERKIKRVIKKKNLNHYETISQCNQRIYINKKGREK